MSEAVFIVGLGACTPVGRSAWASAAAARAGITGFARHPFMVDSVGAPMQVALAPWLAPSLRGVARMEALLMPALAEAVTALGRAPQEAARWALALALPASRPGLPQDLGPQLVARVGQHFKGMFGSAATFSNGHAAGLLAMQAACTKLGQGALDACVVAGVESWLEPQTLEWLETCEQLHGAGPLNNAWGFVPGEAASALLLVRESMARAWGLGPLARVVSVGTAHETKRIKTETVCVGEGLTQALRQALAALPQGEQVADIYCDMNGEAYRADEFGFAALRTKEHVAAMGDFVAPADIWGNVSAAGGLLNPMLACVAAHKGYAKGGLALTWASSETGERAAALLACARPSSPQHGAPQQVGA